MLIRMCWSSRYSGSEIMGFSCKEKGMGLEVTSWGQAGEGRQPRGGDAGENRPVDVVIKQI